MYELSYLQKLKDFNSKLDRISELQWSYLAGIFDGEGSIGLYHSTTKTGTSIMTRITLIVNTDKRLINYVANLIGHEFVYKTNKDNAWCIKISHRVFAEAFLIKIMPYLVAKKDRAENALEFIQLRKGRFHHKYSEEELMLVKNSTIGNAKMGRALW